MRKIRSILLVALLVSGLGLVFAEDHPKTDADTARLQGEWVMVSGSRDGQEIPAGMLKGSKRVAKGNETTVVVGGMLVMKATFTLDSSKTPKTVDYKVTGGMHEGEVELGIYELDGDTVKFCYAIPGKQRPDSFTTKPGDGRTSSVWKHSEK